MALAIYLKEDTLLNYRLAKRRDRVFSISMASVGLLAIGFAAWPLIVWQFITLPKLTGNLKDVPIPQGQVLSSYSALAQSVQVVKDPDGFSYFATSYKPPGPRPQKFLLTVPKLNIQDATARVDSLNFYQSLSHFPGSALPGEVGNSFITGHSLLPQFADPDNYRAIFTKLSDLEVGDDVFVQIDNQTLHFTVLYARVVAPQDISVLAPISAGGRHLTLMTCVPPGTNSKRLVVITSLI